MFKNTIVRCPASSIIDGITGSPKLGKPNFEKACEQHDAYINALKKTGVKVHVLDALEAFPDSCFVEDVAVLTPKGAVITRPGADTRRRETDYIIDTIKLYYPEEKIVYLESPGTLEGGDVMCIGKTYYVGQSARTNPEGIAMFRSYLAEWDYEVIEVPLDVMLHLKTGVNYLDKNVLLVAGEFIDQDLFKDFKKIIVPEEEAYASNCIWMNGTVIVPEGYPETLRQIKEAGFETLEVDTSEFKKIDGGLSCLSLRFSALK